MTNLELGQVLSVGRDRLESHRGRVDCGVDYYRF